MGWGQGPPGTKEYGGNGSIESMSKWGSLGRGE